jgi:hypothetical protein
MSAVVANTGRARARYLLLFLGTHGIAILLLAALAVAVILLE